MRTTSPASAARFSNMRHRLTNRTLNARGRGACARSRHAHRGRFSNGPTWVEYLAHEIAGGQLDNRAYGGSTINNTRVQGYSGALMDIPVPCVTENVAAYVASRTSPGSVLDNDALYIVTGGSNDVFYAWQLRPPIDPAQLGSETARDLVGAIALLYHHGARHFLVPVLSKDRSPYSLGQRRRSGADGPYASFVRTFVTTIREQLPLLLEATLPGAGRYPSLLHADGNGNKWPRQQPGEQFPVLLPLSESVPLHSSSSKEKVATVVIWNPGSLYKSIASGDTGSFTNTKQPCLVVDRDAQGHPLALQECANPDSYQCKCLGPLVSRVDYCCSCELPAACCKAAASCTPHRTWTSCADRNLQGGMTIIQQQLRIRSLPAMPSTRCVMHWLDQCVDAII